MEEHIFQEKIYLLTEYSQKLQWEEQLRNLWRNCFHDPIHYEDFYFHKVYSNNRVYTMKDKGMVHLNYYRCRVLNREMTLPYIVGVATDERYRRRGVMQRLLNQILCDLEEERVPFTYLMPANEEYYKPFDFRSVSKKSECEVTSVDLENSEHFKYMSYGEFQKQSDTFQSQSLEIINQWLEQRYDVYAIHDEDYYDLLYAEKRCQSGDIVFCFDDMVDVRHLAGVFAYAMDGDVPYVEQILVKDGMLQSEAAISTLLSVHFKECNRIKVANAYPYMLRIVHREAFLELFGERLSELSDKPMEEWTNEQMITSLFEEKDNIYFAEIV